MTAHYTHDVATELNNRGAMSLVNGNYQEAIMLFTAALESAMRLQEEQLPTLANDCKNKECEGLEIKVACTNDGAMMSNPLGGHIFRSPLLLVFHSPSRIGPPAVVEVCAITFNVSLAYHLLGITDDGNSALLEKARTLYEKTLQLQQMAPAQQAQIGIFLNMCLANNLAMIHTTLDNEGKSRECLGCVLSDILCILECGKEETHHVLLDGFIDNTMPLILTDSALAPAA